MFDSNYSQFEVQRTNWGTIFWAMMLTSLFLPRLLNEKCGSLWRSMTYILILIFGSICIHNYSFNPFSFVPCIWILCNLKNSCINFLHSFPECCFPLKVFEVVTGSHLIRVWISYQLISITMLSDFECTCTFELWS